MSEYVVKARIILLWMTCLLALSVGASRAVKDALNLQLCDKPY